MRIIHHVIRQEKSNVKKSVKSESSESYIPNTVLAFYAKNLKSFINPNSFLFLGIATWKICFHYFSHFPWRDQVNDVINAGSVIDLVYGIITSSFLHFP